MKHLSRRKAAAYLGFAPNTLKSYEANGTAPTHMRVGGIVRYMLSDLDAWIAEHKVGSAQ